MDTDRPAVENPLKDWVISDKESLVAWVRCFLWHYEGAIIGGPEKLPDDPEVIIVDSLLKVQKDGEGDRSGQSISLPNPSSFFQI